MSYEIIYDKQFAKVGDKYIPFVLAGSNNCYDFSGRRTRSWWSILNDKPLYTLEEMIEHAESVRQNIINRNKATLKEYPNWDIYDDSRFGYFASISKGGHCSNFTYGNFKGIFTTGAKKALTLKQLQDEGVVVSFELRQNKTTGKGTCVLVPTDATSKDIELAWEVYRQDFRSVYLSISGLPEDLKWIRRKYFSRQATQKERTKVNHYYTILIEGDRYLYKMLRHGYRWSRTPCDKLTEAQAKAKLRRLSKRYKGEYTFSMEKVNEEAYVNI